MPTPIVVVEDDAELGAAIVDALAAGGYEVLQATDGKAALELIEKHPVSLVLSDVQMQPMDGYTLLAEIKRRWPQIPVVLMTAYADVARAVQAVRDGATNYLVKPVEFDALLGEVARAVAPPAGFGVALHSPALKELYALAQRVAITDATVLITGESGAGKEVLAQFVHQQSKRATGPFVAVNCAAIPDTLLESTLFGHEKGAFTGATAAQLGKFEQANGGTLLLDEISELPLSLQAKLLRALQEREIERVGGRRAIAVDIRVIATSNRDMVDYVEAGNFREDLYYRLNVFPLAVPSLRSRPQDIGALALRMLHQVDSRYTLSKDALAALCGYSWPGNVRELANVMQRAAILSPGLEVAAAHLMLPQPRRSAPAAPAAEQGPDLFGESDTDLRALERRHILDVLRQANGCRRQAAERLGMPERTLRYKLARWRAEGLVDASV